MPSYHHERHDHRHDVYGTASASTASSAVGSTPPTTPSWGITITSTSTLPYLPEKSQQLPRHRIDFTLSSIMPLDAVLPGLQHPAHTVIETLCDFVNANNIARQNAYYQTVESGEDWDDGYEDAEWAKVVRRFASMSSSGGGSGVAIAFEVSSLEGASRALSSTARRLQNPFGSLVPASQAVSSWTAERQEIAAVVLSNLSFSSSNQRWSGARLILSNERQRKTSPHNGVEAVFEYDYRLTGGVFTEKPTEIGQTALGTMLDLRAYLST